MKKLLAILCCYVLFNASTCEEDIRVPGDSPTSKLVITGELSTEFVIELFITSSLPLFTSIDREYVENASLELFEGNTKIDEFNYDPNTGIYYSNIIPEVDKEYTVKVSAPGFESVEATNLIPRPIEAYEVDVKNINSQPIEDISRFDLEITFDGTVTIDDPADEVNYYHINFYLIDSLVENIDGDIVVSTPRYGPISLKDPINNSPAIPGFTGAFIRDQMFNGQSQDFIFEISNPVEMATYVGGKVELEVRSVSEEYYLYHTSLYRQFQANQVPLSEPVQVFTNVKNGFGLFGGYSFSRKEEVIQE